MTEYKCPRCGYTTKQKSNIRIHYLRKTPCRPVLEDKSIEDLLKSLEVTPKRTFECTICNKVYTSRQGLYNHRKDCSSNKQTLSEVQEHTEKEPISTSGDTTTMMLTALQQVIKQQQTQIAHLQELIDSNRCMQPTQTTQNNTINIFMNTPNEFGNESLDHLTEEYKLECLLMQNAGVLNLLSLIHFNKDKPENHNILFKSAKNKTCLVYLQNRWVEMHAGTIISSLLKKSQAILMPLYRNIALNDERDPDNNIALQKWLINLGVDNVSSQNIYDLRRDVHLLIKDMTQLLSSQNPQVLQAS